MKDILLLTHAADTSTGTTPDWCAERQLTFDIKAAPDLFKAGVKDLADYRAMIIFGGDMEAWEVHENPWLHAEKKSIQGFIEKAKPIFGICLGSQLLAEQLGGTVAPMHKWELGWYPVTMKTEKNFIPLHCHSSYFEIPPRSQLEGTDQFDHAQGFSMDGRYLGYQFHTEINAARLKQVLESLKIAEGGKIQTQAEIEQGFKDHGDRLRNWYFAQLDRWFETTKK